MRDKLEGKLLMDTLVNLAVLIFSLKKKEACFLNSWNKGVLILLINYNVHVSRSSQYQYSVVMVPTSFLLNKLVVWSCNEIFWMQIICTVVLMLWISSMLRNKISCLMRAPVLIKVSYPSPRENMCGFVFRVKLG